MSKLQVKAFIFQLICFVIFFLSVKYTVLELTTLSGLFPSIIAFVIGTFLAPKFKATKTKDGEKLYMSWIFMKGIREIT
jgi:hypothetical protein